MSKPHGPILVTGASGYLASWVVAQLLDEGCDVRATVRKLSDDAKVQHLRDLAERHPGRLNLFEADLLQPGSFDKAVEGCSVVIHTASPYFLHMPKDIDKELISPARQGTLNVIESINRTPSVHRLVITSSVAALYDNAIDLAAAPSNTVQESDVNPNTDARNNPYAYSKTVAEQAAWEAHKAQSRWDLVTIHPGAIFGPSLSRRTDATSIEMTVQFLNGSFKSGVPKLWLGVVDVRDAALAHTRAALLPQTHGRYIAVAKSLTLLEMAKLMRPKDFGIAEKLPKGEVPKFLIWLIAPFIGMTRRYVSRNVGYRIQFNNKRSISELSIKYRDLATTFNDHIKQVASDRLLAN